jgi:hypothetical protein
MIMTHPGFRGAVTPGLRRGLDPRFNRGFFNPRFDRFEDRMENRFNRGLFFDPRFSTRFPGFFPPF